MKLSPLKIFSNDDQIAWVGAGGKTSLIFCVTKELFSDKSLITTTTKMWLREKELADNSIKANEVGQIDLSSVRGINFIFQKTDPNESKKVIGLEIEQLHKLSRKIKPFHLPLLIEADGSKGKPLKFPDTHEPVIPTFVNKVCLVIGLSAIGKALNKENFHRPELISQYLNISMGANFSWADLGKLLVNKHGWVKDFPGNAEKIIFLHQADVLSEYDDVNQLAINLLKHYDHVLLSSIKDGVLTIVAHWGQIGCGILAAGESKRYGSPKQLAIFRKKTFIENVILTALEVNFSNVTVILGANFDLIQSYIKNYPVHIIENKKWNEGQSTSVKECVNFFSSKDVEAIVFILVDQPQISSNLIENIIHKFAYQKCDVVVHSYNNQNRHPILFGKTTFKDLLRIDGEKGGSQLFSKYPPNKIEITDPYFSFDVDRIEDLTEIENRNEK